MTIENPKLKAIVSIRNLVLGISTDWKDLRSLGGEVDQMVSDASTTFINNAPVSAHERWAKEEAEYMRNLTLLRKIMNHVVDRINSRISGDLVETWNQYKDYSTVLREKLDTMNELGKVHLPESSRIQWEENWKVAFEKFNAIQRLAEGSSLHLSMISEYAPEEMDELTDTILKNMPKGYNMEEAAQYETEYMEAYEQIKKEASQKKNLWDRFLDILAGGTQQSPAERVMMQRWVDGEKGDL